MLQERSKRMLVWTIAGNLYLSGVVSIPPPGAARKGGPMRPISLSQTNTRLVPYDDSINKINLNPGHDETIPDMGVRRRPALSKGR